MSCDDDSLEKRAVLYWSASVTWRRNVLPAEEQQLLFDVLNDFDWTDQPHWQARLDELKWEIERYGSAA
tara:strand:+ start:1594 stop:1800 length:207 start_codon:yes stop_codon:yes gene_type:complete